MKIKTGLVLVVFIGFFVFAGCTNPKNESTNESEALVLKSYEVPERLAKEVSETINDLLSRKARKLDNDQPPIGKARIAPDGQLLVAAPESFQNGVKDFIIRFKNANPEQSPSAEVNYWIVAGKKSNKPAKLEEFRLIKPALETIQNTQGNMEFKLLDHVVATSSSQNTESSISGAFIAIDQTVSAFSDDSLIIKLNIGMRKVAINSAIATDLETKNGELVVLGQVSQEFIVPIFTPAKEGERLRGEIVDVFYIISATAKK